jgi:vitamin B12 transporter
MSAGALTYGNESFVSTAINDQLKLRADYTYTIAQDLDTDTDLERRPQNKATLQADWIPIDKLHLSATALFVGAWHDINAETFAPQNAPAYGTLNLAANYDVTPLINAFARIDNLMNRQYEDPLGFLHPGIGVYAGVRVTSF